MRRIAEGVRSRFDEFLAAEIRDTGKPSAMDSHLDIPRGAANFDVFADQIANTSTESFRTPPPDGHGALNSGLRPPRASIAGLRPGNLPRLPSTWKVGPAPAS